VGIVAGTGLYFGNLAYVRAQNEAAAERQAAPGASGTPAAATPGWQQGTDSLYATQQVGAAVDKSGRI